MDKKQYNDIVKEYSTEIADSIKILDASMEVFFCKKYKLTKKQYREIALIFGQESAKEIPLIAGRVFNKMMSDKKYKITQKNSALKEGETYCIICKQVFLKRNLDRHDNSMKHEKMVIKSINKI
jgi:hypothetical protein